MTTMVKNVRGPYRQELVRKRLGFLLPERGVAPPRPFPLKIPSDMEWVKPALRTFFNRTLRSIKVKEPWRAKMTQEFTKITVGRCERYTDSLVTERTSCRDYDQTIVDQVPELVRQQIREGKFVKMSPTNWDVAIPTTNLMVHKRMWGVTKAWLRHFNLPVNPLLHLVDFSINNKTFKQSA